MPDTDFSPALAAGQEIARRQRQMTWRPISTAPKDGTWIIVYDPYFVSEMPVSIGTYMTADERDTCGRFKKGEWLLFEWDGMPSSANPTHWMPLPDAPSVLPSKD